MRGNAIGNWLRRMVVWRFGVRLIPVRAKHFELSVVSSPGSSDESTSRDLVELGLRAAGRAADVDLRHLHNRSDGARQFLSIFPGEHYQLLAALISCVNPTRVIEIGTYTGLSALAMLTTLGDDGLLTTYDVVPWDRLAATALKSADFAGGRLEQRIGNLAEPRFYEKNQDLIQSSELIFIDGPKDGRFEPNFVRSLLTTPRKKPALLIFDDIRLWNMLAIWESLPLPKLDLTSFGHWSGTGICWLQGLQTTSLPSSSKPSAAI